MAGKQHTEHGVSHVFGTRAVVAVLLSSTVTLSVLSSIQALAEQPLVKDNEAPFVLEAQGEEVTGSTTALAVMPKTLQHPSAQYQSSDSTAKLIVDSCEAFKTVTEGVVHEEPTMIDTDDKVTVVSVNINEQLTAMGNSNETFSGPGMNSDTLVTTSIDSTNDNSGVESTEDEVVDIYYAMAKGNPSGTHEVLLKCAEEDPNYSVSPLHISASSREMFERLVMGEAGDEGFEGAALVAQALRDTMIMYGNYDTLSIKRQLKYSGSIKKAPNANVQRACSFILDSGGSAVQHRLIYFYAPKYTAGGRSGFHESQKFVIEWGGHRLFDKR